MSGATAEVKGGLFETMGITSLTQINGKNHLKRTVRQALSTRGMFALRELMETLNGVAAGQAASKTLGRVEANAELGGARTIETDTLVGRNSAAADVTEITADILSYSTKTSFGASPVANLDGNPLGTR